MPTKNKLKQAFHVMPSGKRWRVHRTGASRASAVFDTEAEALRYAGDRLRKGILLYYHGPCGRILLREGVL